MDSNTIKEIANQLGIATDAVTKDVIRETSTVL